MTPSARFLTSALLIAFWGGAAILTIAIVTPEAFAVLPTRTLAGSLVGRVLPALFLSGIIVGVSVSALALSAGCRGGAISAAVAALACVVAQFVINPRIARMRDEIGGPVDALPVDDARRVAFGLLHGYSVGGLGVAMLAAAISLGYLLAALRARD
jgi:hypothetical protein